MPIVLTLHRARDTGGRQRESRTLEEGTLSIGRGPDNGWVLQDPAQHLSKTHCLVVSTPRGYALVDRSSNGVFLNGAKQRLARDSQTAITDGDEFTLGDYLIQARVVQDLSSRTVAASAAGLPRGSPPAASRDDPFGLDDFLSAPAAAPAPAPPATHAAPPPAFDPFADPARSRRDDPFGDDPDGLPGLPSAAHLPFGDPAPRPAAHAPSDPFDLANERGTGAGRNPGADRPAPPAAPQGRGAVRDPFGDDDDLFRGVQPAVEWQGPSQPDNVDAVAHAYVPPRAGPAPDTDWDDLLGDTPPLGLGSGAGGSVPGQPAAPGRPLPSVPPDPVPAASAPQTQVPAPPSPASPQGAPSGPSAPGADAARLIAAFLDGAGVPDLDVSKQDPEAYFRAAGELFGIMVESLRDVLMSRAMVKGEFGVEQTMLRPRDNNALKFSVTPADAVAALLQPGRPGYMPPARAAREAFDDVRIHQLAVMAGVQAALMNLLRTFDPALLEARLQKGGMVESLMPGARRAKLWEAFCAAYKDIARDADSDFQAVFGREFARAYTEQTRAK